MGQRPEGSFNETIFDALDTIRLKKQCFKKLFYTEKGLANNFNL